MGGCHFHPYALRLKQLLAEQLPGNCTVAVDQQGISGEFAVGDMQVRTAQFPM